MTVTIVRRKLQTNLLASKPIFHLHWSFVALTAKILLDLLSKKVEYDNSESKFLPTEIKRVKRSEFHKAN